MKKALALILCVAMILGLLSGCQEDTGPYVPTGDALVIGTETTVPMVVDLTQKVSLAYYPDRSMNPYQCTDYTNRVLFSLLYQGLFTVDRSYQVSPVLCKSYSVSPDMKTYTFTVAAARFSDGTALTAADVSASLNAAKKSPYYSGRFQHITSVSYGNDVVTVKLDTPCENLPILLDIPIVKAAEVNADRPLGTGPYALDISEQGKWLRRQMGWWCSASMAVTASFITLVEAESVNDIRDKFEFDQVSLVCADPGAEDYAQFHCDYELWECENNQFVYLACNEKSEVFSNEKVRTALTHAINRDLLAETYYRGFARSATLPVSPQFPYYDKTLAAKYGYDQEKLTAAVTEEKLTGSEVILLVNRDDELRTQVAHAIADMLKACGLAVTVREEETKDFVACLEGKDSEGELEYDLYLGQTKLSQNMDLSAFFGEEGTLSYGGVADPALYAMSLEALANKGNYYDLHEMVMEDAMLCPVLLRSYAVYAARGQVTTLLPARDNIFYYDLGRSMTDALVKENG